MMNLAWHLVMLMAATALQVDVRGRLKGCLTQAPCLAPSPNSVSGVEAPGMHTVCVAGAFAVPLRLRGGAGTGGKVRDKKEKTKSKRGGGASKMGAWDESDALDAGAGGIELADSDIDAGASGGLAFGGADGGGGVGSVEGMRRGAGGTFHELRWMEEDTPEGWDVCADWHLRVRSKLWWKDQRDRALWESLPTPVEQMFHACRVGAVPWVQELLAAGKVKATDTTSEHWGRAPLHMAAIRGNHLTGRLLVEHGAAVDAQDEHQSTALHAAAMHGHVNMCKMLLELGAAADGVCIYTLYTHTHTHNHTHKHTHRHTSTYTHTHLQAAAFAARLRVHWGSFPPASTT